MKKVPPVSIILAVIWLTGAVVFGIFLHSSKLLHGSTWSLSWSAAFIVLGIANLVSLVGFWCMQRWSIVLYYASTVLGLIAGVTFYVTQAQLFENPEQFVGGFAAKNVSGLLIFTIAFLPYRKEFNRKSNKTMEHTNEIARDSI